MTIEELRKKIINDLEGAFFIGNFGGAILEREKILKASDEELIKIAREMGYNITIVDEKGYQKIK